jgi:hypothetical protein
MSEGTEKQLRWNKTIIEVDSVPGLLHHVVVSSVSKVQEVHAVTIFRIEE